MTTSEASFFGGSETSAPSANMSLHAKSKRVQRLTPTTSIALTLPDARDLPLREGGPVFILANDSASMYIRVNDHTNQILVTLDPGCTAQMFITDHDSEAGAWQFIKTCAVGVTTTTTTTTTTTSTTTTTTTTSTTTSTSTTTTTTTTTCADGPAPDPVSGCLCAGHEYSYTMGSHDDGLADCDSCPLACPQPSTSSCCVITKYLDSWSSACSGVSVIDDGNGNISIIVPPGVSGCQVCINVAYNASWETPCGHPLAQYVNCCTKVYSLCWDIC